MLNLISDNLSDMIFIDKEICGCELAITDKAKCISCKKKIAQGTPRLWVMGELRKAPPDEGIEKIKRFICHGCSSNIITSKENDYQEEIVKGKVAKIKLIEQMEIKQIYYNFLKNEKVIKKVINDEIIQELENEDIK